MKIHRKSQNQQYSLLFSEKYIKLFQQSYLFCSFFQNEQFFTYLDLFHPLCHRIICLLGWLVERYISSFLPTLLHSFAYAMPTETNFDSSVLFCQLFASDAQQHPFLPFRFCSILLISPFLSESNDSKKDIFYYRILRGKS